MLTEEFEVALGTNKLVETYVRLECDTRCRVTEVGVVSRNDGKALALGFPREISYSIYGGRKSVKTNTDDRVAYPSTRRPQ